MLLTINTQKTKLQKGFMITETLITALLIVITMVGILPLLFAGIKSSKVSKVRSVMNNLAQKEVEGFTQLGFDHNLKLMYKFIEMEGGTPAQIEDKKFKMIKNPGIKPLEFPPEFYCVDSEKGTLTPSVSNQDCPKRRIMIKKIYKYLTGDNDEITDDTIRFDLIVQTSNPLNIKKSDAESGKPIKLTALLSKNKL